MVGFATMERLLAAGHRVDFANRGNKYWDATAMIKGRAHWIACDRNALQEYCNGLANSGYYDVVVDFSTYREQQMKDILQLLNKRFSVYVYISTDSVYEVSPASEHGGPSREDDAPQPEQASKITHQERYGREKLLAEHALMRECEDECKYVILRLPDVIGPRDNTQRWWSYQIWLKVHQRLNSPIHIPKSLEKMDMSLVYSKDVATLVSNMVSKDNSLVSNIFNLAFQSTITLPSLIKQMALCMNISQDNVHFTKGTLVYFPSVTRGPIDTTKIQNIHIWRPTDLRQAVCETCAFYEKAALEFPFEFDSVLRKISSKITIPKKEAIIWELKPDTFQNEQSKTEL